MNDLKIYYPYKRYFITQNWGNEPLNADGTPVYAQFGFNKHNGIDAMAVTNENDPDHTTWPIYCPSEGMIVQSIQHYPNGGGNMLFLISKDEVKMFDQECNVWMVFMHCKKILVAIGEEVKLGELIAIADNTGFSTGPHTHFGIYRVKYDGKDITRIDTNEAEGSFDPALFFTKTYAIDQASLGLLIKNNMRYYQYLLTS